MIEKELKTLSFDEIGKRIHRRREALEKSRETLAREMGVTAKFIADIECGSKGMSLKTLYNFMQTLNVSADYILQGEHWVNEGIGSETEGIRERIIVPLLQCNDDELECMEEIAKQYVQAIRGKK